MEPRSHAEDVGAGEPASLAINVVSPAQASEVVLRRLDDQVQWYERRAATNKTGYQLLKLVQIVVAAAIPVLAVRDDSTTLLGALGAVIVVLEAVQQLYQFQQNWISYRTTAEGLKHEKFLYLAGAAHYAKADRPHARLAEAVESLVTQETNTWASAMIDAGDGGNR